MYSLNLVRKNLSPPTQLHLTVEEQPLLLLLLFYLLFKKTKSGVLNSIAESHGQMAGSKAQQRVCCEVANSISQDFFWGGIKWRKYFVQLKLFPPFSSSFSPPFSVFAKVSVSLTVGKSTLPLVDDSRVFNFFPFPKDPQISAI